MYLLAMAVRQFGVLFMTLRLQREIRNSTEFARNAGPDKTPRQSDTDRLAPIAGKRSPNS